MESFKKISSTEIMTTLNFYLAGMELKVFDQILYSESVGYQKFYQTKPYTLGDFFANAGSVGIPDYQRPYSWSKQHVLQLLNDIKKISGDENGSWFIGSLFLMTSSGPGGRIMLLDGQQRSTTVQLIALALYRKLLLLRADAAPMEFALKQQSLKSLFVTNRLEAKFHPIEIVDVIFSALVASWILCETDEEFVAAEKTFMKACHRSALETGYVTASTLATNFKTVLSWTEGLETFDELSDYCNAFADRIWLIQIPMQDDAETVKIFEALNNRGKPLSLVDKLRFRCLITPELRPVDHQTLKGKWGEIYKQLSKLEESHLIKSEDDFFKIFFNGIDGEGRDRNDEFFVQFDKLFATRDGVFHFMEKVKNFLDFLVAIEYPNEEHNWIVQSLPRQKQRQARSFLHVLYAMVRCSANSRFLIAKSIWGRDNEVFSKLSEVLDDCWHILRLVIKTEIEERTASNEVRTDYLEKCKNKNSEDFSSSLIIPNEELVVSLRNFILHEGVNQLRARLLLTIYGFKTSPDAFNVFTQKEIRKTDIDHFIPRAWLANWSYCGEVSKEMIIDKFRDLADKYSHLDIQAFVSAIEQNDVSLEFKEYQTIPHQKERQLLEFIGNRWLLSERINKASSNGDFQRKRQAYQSVGHRVPSDTSNIGILAYDPFTWEDICIRSLVMVSEIKECVHNKNWYV